MPKGPIALSSMRSPNRPNLVNMLKGMAEIDVKEAAKAPGSAICLLHRTFQRVRQQAGQHHKMRPYRPNQGERRRYIALRVLQITGIGRVIARPAV